MADSNVFRWVTRNFYSKTELTAGALATLYYAKTDFLNASAGAGDAGKPVKLDAGGQIDATMINDGDIDHASITSIGTNTHAQIDTHLAATAAHGATGAVVGTTNTQTLSNKGFSDTVQATGFGVGVAPTYAFHAKNGTAAYLALEKSGTSAGVAQVYCDGNLNMDSPSAVYVRGNSGAATIFMYADQVSVRNASNVEKFNLSTATGLLTIGGDTAVTLTGSQTLTNKTLTSATLTTPTIVAAGWANANHTHAGSTTGGTVAHTALTSIGTNTHAQIDTHIAATAAHGVAGAVVGTTDSQTLTNKTLTTPTIATVYGSVSSAGNLTLDSTSHATKGSVLINSGGGYVGAGQFSTFPAYNFEVSALRSAHYYSIGLSPDDASGGRGFIYSRKDGANNPLVLTGSQVLLFSDDFCFNMPNSKVPASAAAAGNAGDIAWGPSFLYVCVSVNSWKRCAISTW